MRREAEVTIRLSPEIEAELLTMSPEDAAAYRKAQLGVAGAANSPSNQKHAGTQKKSDGAKRTAKDDRSDQKRSKKTSKRIRKTKRQDSPKDDVLNLESPVPTNGGDADTHFARAEVLADHRATPQPLEAAIATPPQSPGTHRSSPGPTSSPTVSIARPKEGDTAQAQPLKLPKLGNGREMIINAVNRDECRIAVLLEKKLEEFFIERASSISQVGNIYKGVITNVEASIQAAFVEFGGFKHGFLHISDVQPQYFADRNATPEGVGRKVPRRERPPIQKCFKRGQEVIVQVIKSGMGTKGPTLSTYLSIPGKYLVMMPGMTRLGVSRKIEDEEARRSMRSVLAELKLPKDMGFILRTAGEGRNKRELQRDLNYLERLWKIVVQRVRSTKAPAELYRESDLVTRTIRDVFSTDFDRIIVDTEKTAEAARDFLRIAMPRTPKSTVEVYNGRVPIFHHYGVEEQIEAIHSRHVRLKSGGSIVIDQTEAMVTIDVNSGRLRTSDGEEETAYQTNIEAAQEIARQLRLRDMGGLVVCDFIDMRYDRHKRAVEKQLRDELKKHKERARVLRMSQFGLIELTRQRRGPSIKRGIYADCPHCKGSGLVKTHESMTLHVLRSIQKAIYHHDVIRLTVTVSPEVAQELQNRKRSVLHQIEAETRKVITIHANSSFTWDQQEYHGEDRHGRVNKLFSDIE